MRHDKIIAAHCTPLQTFSFSCTCCEVTEYAMSRSAPEGWAIEYIDGTGYALCADCKIDLPGEHRSAGAMSTRVGVVSQLDAIELIEIDEEDVRHAQRLAGIARAERVGRHVCPMLIAAIMLIGTASIVQHSFRWITA